MLIVNKHIKTIFTKTSFKQPVFLCVWLFGNYAKLAKLQLRGAGVVGDILNFFSYNFSNNVWLAVFIVSMLPIAEAKVAIPFGMATGVWGASALSPSAAALIAYFGSMIPAIFIILFLKPVFEILKKTKTFRKFVLKMEGIFKKKSERQITTAFLRRKQESSNINTNQTTTTLKNVKVKTFSDAELGNAVVGKATEELKNNEFAANKKGFAQLQKLVTLVFFVALPLPLAGVWTSSAIAAFGDMKFWSSVFAIAFGNLLEVLFVTIICTLFIDSVSVVLIGTLILLLAYVLIMWAMSIRKKRLLAK